VRATEEPETLTASGLPDAAQRVSDFDGARDALGPADRLREVRRRAAQFHERFLSEPSVAHYRSDSGNTLEGSIDQYLSMIQEREVAGRSRRNPGVLERRPFVRARPVLGAARDHADVLVRRSRVRRPRVRFPSARPGRVSTLSRRWRKARWRS